RVHGKLLWPAQGVSIGVVCGHNGANALIPGAGCVFPWGPAQGAFRGKLPSWNARYMWLNGRFGTYPAAIADIAAPGRAGDRWPAPDFRMGGLGRLKHGYGSGVDRTKPNKLSRKGTRGRKSLPNPWAGNGVQRRSRR